MGKKVLYREIKSYEDAYKYNCENDGVKVLGATEFEFNNGNDNGKIPIVKTKVKSSNEGKFNKFFKGLEKVLETIFEIILDIVTDFS